MIGTVAPATPDLVLAHAFGERYDLPIPLSLFVAGGAVVVLLSFVLVLLRPPRERPEATGAEDAVTPPTSVVGGVLALVVLTFLCWVGLVGTQVVSANLLPTTFWLVVWVLVPLSCALVGDWTGPVNPYAFLARLSDSDRVRRLLLGSPQPVGWPRRLGWWPAALLFFLAACGELVFNLTVTVPRTLAGLLIGYAVLSTFAGLLFGRSWLQRGEVFSVLFSTWGRLGYLRFGAAGRRGFGGGLDVPFDTGTSRIVGVLLLLVAVNFDGLLATPSWSTLERGLSAAFADGGGLATFRVGAFLLLTAVLAVAFGLAARMSARLGGHAERTSRGALGSLLPSLLPIAFGYLLVHNLQYALVNAQLLFPLLGNPVGESWWPLALPHPFDDQYVVDSSIFPSAVYWYVGVVVIVLVHVVAVVVAHRRLAARAATPGQAHRSEYPWLVAMVAYTMVSLWLIAQPLVQEASHGR